MLIALQNGVMQFGHKNISNSIINSEGGVTFPEVIAANILGHS